MTRRTGKKYRVSPWERASRVLPWLLILCSVACAKADTIIGDLSATDNGTNGFSSATFFWASSFVMGSNDYALSDIQIVLSGMVQSGITFDLESDGGTIPSDDVLMTLVNPLFLPLGINDYTFTPSSPFTLQANTIYWLVATSTSATATHWENSVGDQIPIGAGAIYGSRDASEDDGLIWGGSAVTTNLFEVDGTLEATTPEPGSAGLVLIGLALILLVTGRMTLVDGRPVRRFPKLF